MRQPGCKPWHSAAAIREEIMGRKKRINKSGCRNWTMKIIDMPDDIRSRIKQLADQKRMDAGELICDWILAGFDKMEKRLKICGTGKK